MTDWTTPGVMTDPGMYAYLFDDLPSDVPEHVDLGCVEACVSAAERIARFE